MSRQEHDAKRRAEKPWRAWYKTAAWQARRMGQLRKQPLCERCLKEGRTTAATIANHRTPHRGNATLFWQGELESACKRHHDADIHSEEMRGYSKAIGPDGWPIDPAHPANRPGGG